MTDSSLAPRGASLIRLLLAKQASIVSAAPSAKVSGRKHAGEPLELGGYLSELAGRQIVRVSGELALAQTLRRHNAPRRLVRKALHVACHEVAHAKLGAALASEHGSGPAKVHLQRTGARDLTQLAVDNVVDGCLQSSFETLMLSHQARHAGRRSLRSHFTALARSRALGTVMAFDVHDWVTPQLTATDRYALQSTLQAAARWVRWEHGRVASARARRVLGLPDRDTHAALARRACELVDEAL